MGYKIYIVHAFLGHTPNMFVVTAASEEDAKEVVWLYYVDVVIATVEEVDRTVRTIQAEGLQI